MAATATAGDDQIVLKQNVSWVVGDEIVIGPSRFDAWETESFMVTDVSGDGMTLTLNDSLKYDHIGMVFLSVRQICNFFCVIFLL